MAAADLARERALLDRYAIATSARSVRGGERSAQEPGQSVEFLDYRPYQVGDEPRTVDWRAYARSGRLYTRLYRAERAAEVHLVLDTSASMRLHGKDRFAAAAARLLAYLAQREARGQLHLLDGRSSPPSSGRADVARLWRFLDEAPTLPADALGPIAALTRLVLGLPSHAGAAVVVVLSDLLDPAPLRPALAALRSRRFDAVFVQLLAEAELRPEEDLLELHDVESGERLEVGPREVRDYREAVRAFLHRTRAAVLESGQRHLLLPVSTSVAAADDAQALEREALSAMVRAGVLVRR